MPYLMLNTNVKSDLITAELLQKATDVVGKALGKPTSYVAVHVNPDQKMVFGGTNEPCGCAQLLSIGGINPGKNTKTSEALSKLFEEALGITSDRLYIHFVDAAGSNIGYNGGVF